MLLRSVAFIAVYIGAIGALMYVNTAWFALGDVKFGRTGWQLYWPFWAILYAPAAVSALIAVAKSRRPPGQATPLALAFLAVILVAIEISFVLDVNFVCVVVEWAALSILFFSARNWWLTPNHPRGFEVLDVSKGGPGH